MDLRSHVIQSSEFGREIAWSISTLDWTSEAKISNFEDKILIKKKILWFEISMGDFLTVAVA